MASRSTVWCLKFETISVRTVSWISFFFLFYTIRIFLFSALNNSTFVALYLYFNQWNSLCKVSLSPNNKNKTSFLFLLSTLILANLHCSHIFAKEWFGERLKNSHFFATEEFGKRPWHFQFSATEWKKPLVHINKEKRYFALN